MELGNRLQSSLGRPFPSIIAFEHPTLAALTQYLAGEVLELGELAAMNGGMDAAEQSTSPGEAIRVAAIASLSDAEAEAALLEELERAGY